VVSVAASGESCLVRIQDAFRGESDDGLPSVQRVVELERPLPSEANATLCEQLRCVVAATHHASREQGKPEDDQERHRRHVDRNCGKRFRGTRAEQRMLVSFHDATDDTTPKVIPKGLPLSRNPLVHARLVNPGELPSQVQHPLEEVSVLATAQSELWVEG